MKRIVILTMLAVTFGLFSASRVNAQAFGGKGSMTLNVGIGGSWHFVVGPGTGWGAGWGGYGLGLNAPTVSMEFGVHQYVGVGFWVAPTHHFGVAGSGWYGLSIPIAARGDFHFYQLIADKTGKNIHADQLDIYAGFVLGGGPYFQIDPSGSAVGVIAVGPHAGCRWYPKAGKIGIYAEVAPYIGKSFMEVGAIFKLK